jgi:hypothetical protein
MTEQQPPTKARRGCLFYGCIGGLVMLLVIVIAGLIGLHYFKKMYNDFTDSQPASMPAVHLTQAETDEVRRRVDSFRDSVRAKRPTPALTLTADEINALIANNADLKSSKTTFYITLADDKITGQLSVPLEKVGLTIFKGRYLNGSGTFLLSFQNGVLHVTAQNITVKGKPLPEVYMDSIRKQDLARDLDASAALERIQDIQVKDGKITIVPKETP